MKTEQQYFEEAITLQQYMEDMTQLKEQSLAVYEGFNVPTEDGFIDFLKDTKLRILTITEDWCGDAMLNNPVIRRIAEAASLEVRAVFRDADTDLIDRYLTNGGRAIPIYILLDDVGEVVGTWGPRAPELQQYVMELRAGLPDKEDPSFEDAQKDIYTKMRTAYVEDPQYARYVYEDFKTKILSLLK